MTYTYEPVTEKFTGPIAAAMYEGTTTPSFIPLATANKNVIKVFTGVGNYSSNNFPSNPWPFGTFEVNTTNNDPNNWSLGPIVRGEYYVGGVGSTSNSSYDGFTYSLYSASGTNKPATWVGVPDLVTGKVWPVSLGRVQNISAPGDTTNSLNKWFLTVIDPDTFTATHHVIQRQRRYYPTVDPGEWAMVFDPLPTGTIYQEGGYLWNNRVYTPYNHAFSVQPNGRAVLFCAGFFQFSAGASVYNGHDLNARQFQISNGVVEYPGTWITLIKDEENWSSSYIPTMLPYPMTSDIGVVFTRRNARAFYASYQTTSGGLVKLSGGIVTNAIDPTYNGAANGNIIFAETGSTLTVQHEQGNNSNVYSTLVYPWSNGVLGTPTRTAGTQTRQAPNRKGGTFTVRENVPYFTDAAGPSDIVLPDDPYAYVYSYVRRSTDGQVQEFWYAHTYDGAAGPAPTVLVHPSEVLTKTDGLRASLFYEHKYIDTQLYPSITAHFLRNAPSAPTDPPPLRMTQRSDGRGIIDRGPIRLKEAYSQKSRQFGIRVGDLGTFW